MNEQQEREKAEDVRSLSHLGIQYRESPSSCRQLELHPGRCPIRPSDPLLSPLDTCRRTPRRTMVPYEDPLRRSSRATRQSRSLGSEEDWGEGRRIFQSIRFCRLGSLGHAPESPRSARWSSRGRRRGRSRKCGREGGDLSRHRPIRGWSCHTISFFITAN